MLVVQELVEGVLILLVKAWPLVHAPVEGAVVLLWKAKPLDQFQIWTCDGGEVIVGLASWAEDAVWRGLRVLTV